MSSDAKLYYNTLELLRARYKIDNVNVPDAGKAIKLSKQISHTKIEFAQ